MIRLETGKGEVRVIRDGALVVKATKAEAARMAFDPTVDERVRQALKDGGAEIRRAA